MQALTNMREAFAKWKTQKISANNEVSEEKTRLEQPSLPPPKQNTPPELPPLKSPEKLPRVQRTHKATNPQAQSPRVGKVVETPLKLADQLIASNMRSKTRKSSLANLTQQYFASSKIFNQHQLASQKYSAPLIRHWTHCVLDPTT